MTGQEAGYQRFYSRSQSSTNSSSESDAASPIKSPRLEGRQTSVFSWSPSSPEESHSLARYKQNVRRRLKYLYRQMSPQNLDDTTDSEVRPMLEAEQESVEGIVETDTGRTSAAGDNQTIADARCRAEVGMISAAAEHLGGTVAEKVYTELMPMQLEPVEHDTDLLLNAEESALPVETGTAEPAMSQLAELVLTDGVTSQTVQPAMATDTVGSAMTHLVELGQTGGATWQSAQPAMVTDTVGSAMPQLTELVPTDEATSQSVQYPAANASVGSATPQLIELVPADMAAYQTVQPAMTTDTVGSAMTQLAELVPTDGATSQSVQYPAANASVGSATPQLTELVPADMAASQTVQPAITNTVGSAMTHLVELGQPSGATWQPAHPSNSFPLNFLSTNGPVNPTAPWLPTPYVQFVGPTAPLMNQTPSAEQNASVWTVGSASPISNATVGSAVPQLVQLVPTHAATWQLAHSSNSFALNILSTNMAVNQMVPWMPVIPCVQFVVPTAPLIYQLPGAQQNAVLYSVGSLPMTTTTDLLTGSPYGVSPSPSVQSVTLSDLQTPRTEVADVGNPYSLEISGSQQTISEAETAAVGLAMTGAVGSAPTAETSSSLSQGSRESSPVTTPADSPISGTQSSTGTNTSPSMLEMAMLSNLSEFCASTAAKTAPKTVQTKVVSNVRARAPVFSSGMKGSSSTATNQDKTIGSEQTIERPKLTVKKTTATVQLPGCPKLMLKTTATSVQIPGRPKLSLKKSAFVLVTGPPTQTANLSGSSSDPRPSSLVDVSMLSNVGEFSASTGAQREVTNTTKDAEVSSTTRGKRAAAKTGVRKKKQL